MPAWSARTGRSASTPSSIAARRKNRGWCSASTAAANRADTVAYLRAREQVTMVYVEAWRQVWLDDDPRQSVSALCYMVDRGHQQYAGRLSLAEQLHYVRQGHGRSGPNRDYVLAAVDELARLKVRDDSLRLLAERLKGAHDPMA